MEKTDTYISFERDGVEFGLSKGKNWGFAILSEDKQSHAQLDEVEITELVSWILQDQDSKEKQQLSRSIDRNEHLRKLVQDLRTRLSVLTIKTKVLVNKYQEGENITSEDFFELRQELWRSSMTEQKALNETS